MENDDFLDTIETTGVINPSGGTIEGNIEVASDSDWFAFEMDAGQIFQFMLDLGNVDLDVYDSDGNLVASSPSGFRGDTTANDLYFSATEAGTYYLSVTGIVPRAGEAFTGTL